MTQTQKDQNNNEIVIFNEIFEPYPLADDGYLYHRPNIKQNSKVKELTNIIINNNNELKVSIKIKNEDLIKVNYINYLDNNFDLIEYFGDLKQFIPFSLLINRI